MVEAEVGAAVTILWQALQPVWAGAGAHAPGWQGKSRAKHLQAREAQACLLADVEMHLASWTGHAPLMYGRRCQQTAMLLPLGCSRQSKSPHVSTW